MIDRIIESLKSERDRIDDAIRALEGGGRTSTNTGRIGRPRGHRMSAATRKRMSDAMKRRWASGQMGKRKKAA